MKFENIRTYNFENALRGMRNPKESYDLCDSDFGFGDGEKVFDIAKTLVDKYKNEPSEDNIKKYAEKIIIAEKNNIYEYAAIGPNDMKLAKNLIRAGSEHRKFMRQIFVSVDITAPLYWWKEADTYKIATVSNSTSTMHTIHKKPITLDCFEIGDYDNSLPMIDDINLGVRVDCFIDDLEQLRNLYLMYNEKAKAAPDDSPEKAEYEHQAKCYWKELIRWLPESWIQTRTWTGNYENLLGICGKGQRRHHKLSEWSKCDDSEVIDSFIKFARSLPYAQDFIFLDEIL